MPSEQGSQEGASPSSDQSQADTKPRLTDAQKKKNHVKSENKRRENIREQYELLARLVPGMAGNAKSEHLLLGGAVDWALELMKERKRMVEEIEARGGVVDDDLKKHQYDARAEEIFEELKESK